ncbi:ABC-type transport system involved in resistance to organic solvents, ATPase component [Xenococcus sp. PCC 7305]|uniref:ABC transporter ATP-binding protein n=1 Tax=Xenococcus sp. PCC 7305 TaxID=102125 RepID=UPI0002ABA66F|nr:ATP-binding cassette domain-containing protein [Xenococcus sp. PCC 7305]ELS01924.1 ABC-type transport system involved in resistance to organic solvents, ATPase component [Xenococcus sp. PCC 7305]
MVEPIVELRGVSKSFGPKKVLDNVDLKIYPGDALGVIGPSGCGKSTVLRVIAGLLKPDSGDVYINGKKRESTVEEGADSLGVGMVFQQSALFDSLTVDENVGFALYRYSKLPPKKIRELVNQKLEIVGLPGTGDLYPAELSGGMRKKASLARAILTDPSNSDNDLCMILYDEPTAGLDPIASTRIENLIHDLLFDQGVCQAYAIVTHQASTIQLTTERIIFSYQGKIQWDGKRDEAYCSTHPLLKQFFSGSIEGPIP